MNTTRYRIKIEGITALVMNANMQMLDTDSKDSARDKGAWEREHFMEKTYRNADMKFVIPARAIKKAFVDGSRFVTSKPKGIGFKSWGPIIVGAAIVCDDAVLDVAESKVKPLTMVVNLDPTKGPKGGRGPRTRPAITPPWHAETEVEVLDPILTLDVLQDIAERAGKQVGLLDGRAIDFGRCFITVERMK